MLYQAATQMPDVLPDIVVIMNETFSDPAVLQSYTSNRDPLAFFRSLEKNTVRGLLNVNIVGGNTATSEFEFLTSDSMYWLPRGAVAYQQQIKGPRPSLVSWLKSLGYETVGMHPYYPGGWSRKQAYTYFGFDQMLFLDDFQHQEKLRQFVSDQAVSDEIYERFLKGPQRQKPAFVFAVTMQNHGGYGESHENFKPSLKSISPKGSRYFDTYLSLIEKSDEALESLVRRLAREGERPTLLVFFGDHQPNDYVVEHLTQQKKSQGDGQERYRVPYIIWANYDISEAEGQDSSLNFLAGQVLDLARLPKSAYLRFLGDLNQELGVLTQNVMYDRDGQRYLEAETAPFAELLQRYQRFQYNHLVDRKHRYEALFGSLTLPVQPK